MGRQREIQMTVDFVCLSSDGKTDRNSGSPFIREFFSAILVFFNLLNTSNSIKNNFFIATLQIVMVK